MLSTIRLIFLALAGLVMTAYGVFHSVNGYPGPAVFDRLSAAAPTLAAVTSFVGAVLLAVAGSVMLALAIYRIRRRKPRMPDNTYGSIGLGRPAAIHSRPSPAYRDDGDLDAGGEGFDFDDDPENPGYRGDGRDNGRLDRRRRAESYR